MISTWVVNRLKTATTIDPEVFPEVFLEQIEEEQDKEGNIQSRAMYKDQLKSAIIEFLNGIEHAQSGLSVYKESKMNTVRNMLSTQVEQIKNQYILELTAQ